MDRNKMFSINLTTGANIKFH